METIAKIKKRVFLRKKGYTINASRNKAWQLLSNLKILFPVEVITVFTTVEKHFGTCSEVYPSLYSLFLVLQGTSTLLKLRQRLPPNRNLFLIQWMDEYPLTSSVEDLGFWANISIRKYMYSKLSSYLQTSYNHLSMP